MQQFSIGSLEICALRLKSEEWLQALMLSIKRTSMTIELNDATQAPK
jgi:hypothetical protein